MADPLCGTALWDKSPKTTKSLNLLAHPTRFERVTFAFGGQRSHNQSRNRPFDQTQKSSVARPGFEPRRVKKMKLLKGDSFPIFLVSDGVSQQSCRGHLSKVVARSSGCRRSVQRFRCSMAVFELLARATGACVVAAGNGHLVNRSSRIADGVPRRSAAGKPVRMDVAGGWRYQVNQYLMSRVGVLVSLD